MKKLFLLLIIMLVALQGVAAERYVNFNVYEALIVGNDVVKTSVPIDNVNVEGFVCTENCGSYSSELQSTNSGIDNSVIVTYPTSLQSVNGYAHIFSKDGYVTWAQTANFYGTDSSDPQGPYNVYLGKVSQCRSAVDSVIVINDAHPNEPVQFEVNTSMDATVWSPINFVGPVGFESSVHPQNYEVNTDVTLEIWNENVLVYTETKLVPIHFSGAERVMFEWLPDRVGRYEVRITSSVNDNKCLSSDDVTSSKQFSVIGDTTEVCYALANSLSVQPLNQPAGTPTMIAVETISNYYDSLGELFSLPGKLHLEVQKGNYYDYQVYDLPEGGIMNYEQNFIPYSFPEAGEYSIKATVFPYSCPYTEKTYDVEELSYLVVEGNYSNQTNTPPVINAQDLFFNETGFYNDIYNLEDYSFDNQPSNTLSFAIITQSDVSVASCVIDTFNNLDCDVLSSGQSVVELRVTDSDGLTGMDLITLTSDHTHLCEDGLDNDGDGLIDMQDPGCLNELDDDESDDPLLPECSDGIDNDLDGFIDMNDPGCSSSSDINEADATTLCQDGLDNDGDSLIDMQDSGCANSLDNDESDFFDLFAEATVDYSSNMLRVTPVSIPLTVLASSEVYIDGVLVDSNLPFNQESEISISNLSNGQHTALIVVDSENYFVEDNEGNNYLTLTFSTFNSSSLYFTSVQKTVGYVGVSYSFNLETNIPSNISLISAPSEMTINNGVVSWIPSVEGSFVVSALADSGNDVAYITWVITVHKTGGVSNSKVVREGLTINSIRFNEFVSAGEEVSVQVGMTNDGANLDESRLTITVYDLGIQRSIGSFDLGSNEETKTVRFVIPSNAPSGEYLVRVSIGNTELRRVVHRYITVQ